MTVDYQTLKDDSVTVRERDSTSQVHPAPGNASYLLVAKWDACAGIPGTKLHAWPAR